MSSITFSFGVFAAGIFKHTQNLMKSVLTDLYHEEQSEQQGRYNGWSSMGFIIGPALSGHIVDLGFGFQALSLITATLFALNVGM